MFGNILTKFMGSKNDRDLKKIDPLVNEINGLEAGLEKLSDDQLREKTDQFRARLSDGTALDDILPEAFAVVREASKRTVGMRQFRCPVGGWNRSPPRQDCRDEDGRRQDARGDFAGIPERLGREGCSYRHRQRLPG